MKKLVLTAFMAACGLLASAQDAEQRVTFHGVVDLVNAVAGNWMPAPQPIVEASGLHLAFYSCNDEVDCSVYNIIYTNNTNLNDTIAYNNTVAYNYAITGPNACVLSIQADTSSGATISFADEADYNRFMQEAFKYGLLQAEGSDLSYYYVNNTPIEGGGLTMVSYDMLFPASPDTDKAYYQPTIILSAAGKDESGWYTYNLGLDF